MKPSEIGVHLGAYADGELDERLRAALSRHVASDAAARAEVERWQALRRSAQRSLAAEPVPANLHARVLHSLTTARRSRAYRRWSLFGGAAAAAALVLALVYGWPQVAGPAGVPAAVPVVQADAVAKVYYECGCTHHHDRFGLAGKLPAEAARLVAAEPEVGFAVHLPDFSAAGFRLAGVCNCPVCEGVCSVHAHYVRGPLAAGQPSEPHSVVSFFSMACQVELGTCAKMCTGGRCLRHPDREYVVASTAGGVTVLKWDEWSCSLAVCSDLDREELLQLVDAVDLAALSGTPAPATASVPGASSLSMVAMLGLVCVLGLRALRG